MPNTKFEENSLPNYIIAQATDRTIFLNIFQAHGNSTRYFYTKLNINILTLIYSVHKTQINNFSLKYETSDNGLFRNI